MKSKLLALFNEMIEITHNNSPASQQILSSITINILALLYSNLQSKRVGDEPGLRVVQDVIARMREAAEKPWILKNWPASLTSLSLLSEGPSLHTGLSPHKYLQEIRLARARSFIVPKHAFHQGDRCPDRL